MEIPQHEKGTWDAIAGALEEAAEDGRGETVSHRRMEG
jgi:hypothetical protein